MRKPAVSLAAVAGRRQATLELAQRLEQEGFSGIYCPSFGDGMGLCEALALVTKEIPFGTSIANIYTRHPYDYALSATLIHELSGGRFRFGIGVSHAPMLARLKVQVGKPLSDVRQFVLGPANRRPAQRRPAAHRAGHPAPENGATGVGNRPGRRCGPMPPARTWRRRWGTCRRQPARTRISSSAT